MAKVSYSHWIHSAIAHFRCGTAPLCIETLRNEGFPEEERMCFQCKDCVLNEIHALLKYPLYKAILGKVYSLSCHWVPNIMGCVVLVRNLKRIFACNDEFLVRNCAKGYPNILPCYKQ